MAAINSVPKSIHIPLAGLNASRVLMCHASVGTDNSVTLKLRDTNGLSDATQLANASATTSALENVLTIDYSEADMIADVLGTLQSSSHKNNNANKLVNVLNTAASSTDTTTATTTKCLNTIQKNENYIQSNTSAVVQVNSSTAHKVVGNLISTTNSNTKTSSYIKNCLIRSSSNANNNHNNNNNNNNNINNNNNSLTTLAQIMSHSSSSSSTSSSNHSHSSSGCPQGNNGSTVSSSSSSTSSNNSNSSTSNFSSNSNDSISSSSNNSSSNSNSIPSHQNKNPQNVPASTNPPKSVKKHRSKALSPTRHGPQQCQICNKIFGNASALAKHKLTHSDERKYVCSMCTKAFKRQDHLNGHMMTHRNKKPYECKAEGCSKSYCDARSLRRHTENHHAGLTLTSSQTQSLATNIINSNLSPTATNGEISTVDANTLRTYIANGNSLVDATTGETLTEDQIKTISLPINTTVSLLSPASSSSSHNGSMSNANCSNLTVAETAFEGEGLTPKQLDLISQIMQRNKQTSAQVTVSSPTSVNSYKIATANSKSELLNGQKPRTWNMQLLNQTKKISITVDEIASVELFTKHDGNTEMNEPKTEEEMNVHTGALVHPNLLKNDLKPVECNLCHRKFKNIPALNGHMRLHGGYFKKDPEAKKNEKKESNGPPLQTASIGVRALIEEKIISKRGKDLNKNAFIVPAPPGTLLNTKAPQNISFETQTVAENKTTNNGLITTTIQLPNATTIINAKQHKYSNNVRLAVGTNSPPLVSKTINYYPATTNVIGKSDETELKDSTLIELLKRGTRVAVTQRKTTNNGNLILNNTDVINKNNNNANNKSIEIPNANQILNSNNRTLIIPADIHMVTKSKNDTNTLSSASLHLADGTPLSLTISNDNDIGTTEKTYSVTYADDESQFLNENSSVYNLSDSEMLVNTVEPMHFLNDTATEIKTEHSEQYTNEHNNDNCSVIVEDITDDVLETFMPKKSDTAINVCTLSPIQSPVNGYPTIQLPTQLNTNAPLPNFQQFHSKEIIMQTSAQLQALTANSRSNTLTLPSFTSPMHSPLQYPTPPSSHENVTQSSPFIEDRHANYIEGSNTNSFFGDKCDLHEFLTQTSKSTDFFKANQNDNELQKTLNETDTTFGSSIEVEDLLNGSQDAGACDLPEFSETNLSFLDDDQLFLNDTQNESSSLSKSFFTGSVDDVKRMLRDVLCEENIIMNSTEQRNENIVDLCYIAGVGMMSNSDDPLLSSSSHEFGQRLQIQDSQQNTDTKANGNVEEKMYLPQAGNQSLLQQQLQQQLPEQPNETQNQQFEQQQVVNQTTNINESNNAEQIVIYATNKLTKETLLQHTKQYEQQHNNEAMTKQVEDTKQTAVESIDEVDGHCSQNKTTDATSMLESCLQFPVPESSIKIVSNLQPISNYTKSLLKRRYQTTEMNDSVAKKSCTQTTYHSKLRKPSRTHYTAPPMLNPDRDGLGLYSSVRRKLNGGTLPFETFSSDDFSDHIGLAEFSDESKVNLGSDYQAQIPQLRQRRGLKFNIDVQETVPAEILWDPKAQTDEGSLKRFIELSKSSTGPLGSHTEEDALTTLLRAKGNISTAILTLLQTPSNQFTNKWSASDMEVFFRSMERFGKDFSKISNKVSTKSIGDCVQLYYFWKKLCVEQKVVNYKKDENKSNYKITTEYLKSALKQDDKLRCKLKPTTTTITTTATATIMKSEMQSINRIINNDVGIQNTDESTNNSFSSSSNNSNNSLTEVKPFMCEMPDCSASFMSKAALHGHTRIHSTNAKNDNSNCAQHMNGHIVNSNSACTPFKINSNLTAPMSDCASKNGTQQQHTQCVEVVLSQYPCKMCGKIFTKVKSRSAHMKTHRSQEMATQNQYQQQQQQQQNQQIKQTQLQPQTEILRLLQATTTFNLKPKANDDHTSQRIMENI